MRRNVGNCTAKRRNINKRYTADLIFIFLTLFDFPQKISCFWTSVTCCATPCHLVIGARYFETPYWPHIQLSNIIINISLNEGVFVIISRKVDNILPGATESHLFFRDTEFICLNPELNSQSWGTHDLEGTETNDFKGVLGKEYDYLWFVWQCILNPLTPNDPYIGRTAPLKL